MIPINILDSGSFSFNPEMSPWPTEAREADAVIKMRRYRKVTFHVGCFASQTMMTKERQNCMGMSASE